MRNLIGCLLFLASGLLMAADSTVHEYQLDNGLKLIVKRDHRAPVVVSQVWYRVGASYEHDGITGISHVLEHMMFKGTHKHPAGEFSKIISDNGGNQNAFTSGDYTAYFQRLEKSRLEVSFELEADRMRNLDMQDEEFRKEIKVVMEERRMRTDNKPSGRTYEKFVATAFTSSSARIPTIGWMNDLENMEVADLEEWYARWYAPNNAIVVVVGDVDPGEVLALAKKHFGPLKPETIRAPKPRIEPEQEGMRQVLVKMPAEVPYMVMGYKVPVVNTAEQAWEPYALAVLSGILDGGDSARLKTDMVRGSAVAASAGASYDPYERQESLFVFHGTPSDSHTVDDMKQAFLEQVRRLQASPASDAEMARIKSQVVASDVFELDSIFYQGMKIGKLESVGLDWRIAGDFVERINAVTPEQVMAVAKKYLVEDRMTFAELVPLPMDNGNGDKRGDEDA